MEKLADISAFESLGDKSSAVFNGSWNYYPSTVKNIPFRCARIKKLADNIASLVKDEKYQYMHQMKPTKVLMLEEMAHKLFSLAELLHKDAVGASDAAERKHYRNAIAEKHPDIDLSDVSSAFEDALAARDRSRINEPWVPWSELDPDAKLWREYDIKKEWAED